MVDHIIGAPQEPFNTEFANAANDPSINRLSAMNQGVNFQAPANNSMSTLSAAMNNHFNVTAVPESMRGSAMNDAAILDNAKGAEITLQGMNLKGGDSFLTLCSDICGEVQSGLKEMGVAYQGNAITPLDNQLALQQSALESEPVANSYNQNLLMKPEWV